MSVATLLVVEDDPLQMDMLEMILTRHNMNLLRASTGEAALDVYRQHPEIDLILLDVMLPGRLDGLAVCRQVRAEHSRFYVPIIMVTALGKTEQLVQGLDAGADDYITKPFSSRELMARVQAGLRIRRTQHDLAETQNRYRLLVETARDLIFALDARYRLTYISPMSETLTGYPPESLLADSTPFASIIHPDDAQRLSDWYARLREQPEGSDLELRLKRADGDLRWGTLAWTTVYNREGAPAGVQGTLRDITHRKAVEAATWRRSQELAALNLIAARLNQSLQLSNTLPEALQVLLEVVDSEFGAILAIRDRRAIVRAVHGMSEADARGLAGSDALSRWSQRDLDIAREALEDETGIIDPVLKRLGAQAVAIVPLRERGELIGLLILASRLIEKFETTEITLISTVAEQISAAMINARLYEEAQHRAEELSILYDVGHMLTSTLDLTKVLRVIMEAAVSMLQVEAGSVLLLDEATQELEFVAAVGAGSEQIMGLRLPAGAGIAGQALSEGRSLLVDDTQESTSFYEAVDHLTGLSTHRLIATPLRVKERYIGVMEVINKRRGPFTVNDVRVLDLLAPTAATAIDNARLYARETQLTDEVRRHNRELSALHAISAALSQSLKIQDVLDAALIVLQPQFEYDGGFIYLDGDEDTPAAQAQHTSVEDLRLDDSNSVAREFIQQALGARSVQVLPDTTQVDQKATAWSAAHIGALAAVPLWGHDVVQGGLVIAWQEPHPLDHATIQLLAAIGQQIGVALERAALYDVAQRRAQEIERSYAQLVQSEKLAATGRLAMSLAHEINNPLQAIQNCLHLVLELPLPEDRKVDYLRMAREEVERLSILVQSMLDFYRPARGGQLIANARLVLDRVLALADQKLRSSQIETQLRCPDEPLLVQAPPDQLGQVFLNLIMNAAEAMVEGGTLFIEAEPQAEMIEMRFRDTGVGIPPDVLSHIFEPFYTTKDEGTGLGLAISYTIIERQGGLLQVESEEGRGTQFTVRLLRAEQPTDDAAQPEAG